MNNKNLLCLEDKRNALLNDYRRAVPSEKVKIMLEIMEIDEELRCVSASFSPKQKVYS